MSKPGMANAGRALEVRHPPGLRRRALRLALAVLILVLSLELALGIGLGLGKPVLARADADCGYLPAANQHIFRFFCHNDINAFGMRSGEVPAVKAPGGLRLLFIGDSVAYGTTHVDQSRIFTQLVARELPGRLGRSVEVLNASAGGWAVGNEVGYLRSRGTFSADEVIFVLNTGDLFQPFNRLTLRLELGTPEHAPPGALYELWMRYLRPKLTRAPTAVDAGSTPATAPSPQGVGPILDQLAVAQDLCRSAGARFGIVYSPARGELWETREYREAWGRLKGWAAERAVPLLDLSATYGPHAADEIYQGDGIHLTVAGNRLAANAIESQWPWLVSPRRP